MYNYLCRRFTPEDIVIHQRSACGAAFPWKSPKSLVNSAIKTGADILVLKAVCCSLQWEVDGRVVAFDVCFEAFQRLLDIDEKASSSRPIVL